MQIKSINNKISALRLLNSIEKDPKTVEDNNKRIELWLQRINELQGTSGPSMSLVQELTELKQNWTAKTQEIKRQMDNMERLAQALLDLKKNPAVLENAIAQIRNYLDTESSSDLLQESVNMKELQTKLQEAESRAKTQTSALEKVQKELESAKSSLSRKTAEATKQMNEVTTLNKELELKKTLLKKTEEEKQAATLKIKTLEDQIAVSKSQSTTTRSDASAKVEQLYMENDTLKKEKEEWETKYLSLEDRYESNRRKMEGVVRQYREAKDKIKQLKKQLGSKK